MMYDDDDDLEFRNARRRRPRPGMLGPMRRPMAPAGYGPVPWAPPPSPAPAVDRYTGTLKLGVLIDAAAQALAAMSGLPPAPPSLGDSKSDTQNLVKYQESLAQHAKRDEQIRTLGALARLFLV